MTVPVRITMTLEGEAVIDRVLAGIESRAGDLAPAWPAVVTAFQQIVGRAFATEGASTGAAWPQLAKSTQADRARRGYGAAHPILRRTGKLERALTLGEGAAIIGRPTSLSYRLPSELDYFVYHQSNRPRTRLPRRAPVQLTADDKHEIVRPIRLYLTSRDPSAPQRRRIG